MFKIFCAIWILLLSAILYLATIPVVVAKQNERSKAMPSVIKLPAYDSTSGTGTFTIHPDIDGHSIWVFQYFNLGLKRIDLNTQTVTNDLTLPVGFNHGSPDAIEDGTVIFFQDSMGAIWFAELGSISQIKLHKFTVSGNTMTDVGSFGPINVASTTPGQIREPENWTVHPFVVGGKDYVSLAVDKGARNGVILNLTDMVVVGYIPVTSTNVPGAGSSIHCWSTFQDKNGDIWWLFTSGSGFGNDVILTKWHPADGVSGHAIDVNASWGNSTDALLVCTHHLILQATLGTAAGSAPVFAGYDATNHRVVLGNAIQDTGDVLVIDLMSFTRTAFKADDGMFFYATTFDAASSVMRTGVQTPGSLMIPGDLLNSPNPDKQRGGIVNIVDPQTLAIQQTYNISDLILNSAYAATLPPRYTDSFRGTGTLAPHANLLWFPATGYLIVTYEFEGSPTYLITGIFGGAAPTPGNVRVSQYAVEVAVSGGKAAQQAQSTALRQGLIWGPLARGRRVN